MTEFNSIDCYSILLGKPSIIRFQAPSSLTTYVGQSAVFHCDVVGDPEPVVNWKNSSNSIISGGVKFQVFSNHTLKIINLQKSDDGNLYTCEAENSYGVTAASATLRVNGRSKLNFINVTVLPKWSRGSINFNKCHGPKGSNSTEMK